MSQAEVHNLVRAKTPEVLVPEVEDGEGNSQLPSVVGNLALTGSDVAVAEKPLATVTGLDTLRDRLGVFGLANYLVYVDAQRYGGYTTVGDDLDIDPPTEGRDAKARYSHLPYPC